jgi:type II secretory pathway pseudopilin PulG
MPKITVANDRRRGSMLIELLVAFTLLTALLGAALPLIVRHQQLLASARTYRLALDELSNQLETLSALDAEQLPAALESLALSPFAAERLPDAELDAVLDASGEQPRVALSLTWDEPGRRDKPLTLVAWLDPPAQSLAQQPQEEQP